MAENPMLKFVDSAQVYPEKREAVLRAVNLGDDADTTGAVCGQLAGAYWSEDGIPAEWRTGLARRDLIEQALAGLLAPINSRSISEGPGATIESPASRVPYQNEEGAPDV